MENNEQNQAVKQPAQDLVDKVQATKALVTTHSLLGIGMFQHRHSEALQQSIDFLAALHKQILTECLKHPDANLVPDLVEYAEQAKKQEEKLVEDAKKEQE
jgi:hypothetical protein